MLTKDFFTKLLGLNSSWQVEDISVNLALEEIYIDINYISNIYQDPITQEQYKLYDLSPLREWRHIDTLQYKTYLRCRLPRIIDANKKIKQVSPPWASKHNRYTHLFEERVIKLLLACRNQTKTSQLMRCGFNVVNRIIHQATKRGLDRREISYVKNIGIDEKSYKKGHNYASVLTDSDLGIILDIEEGRTLESTENLLNKVFKTKDKLDSIETISMDMWESYINTSEKMLP